MPSSNDKNIEVNKNPMAQENTTVAKKLDESFPKLQEDRERLLRYQFYNKLFLGQHFDAFNIRIENEKYGKMYERLRYIAVNFAGLLSKIMADMIFSEPVNIRAGQNQKWVDAFIYENNLHTQLYESSLLNSAWGDDLFKLRVGPKHPENPRDPSIVIVEETAPSIYFVNHKAFNIKADPESQEIAWKFKIGDNEYVRKEIHYIGRIENKVFRLEGGKITTEVDLSILNEPGLLPVEPIKIDRWMLVHVPNWKTPQRYWGVSDYFDLESLFFGINNRMTMIDNILDKHSDPILMVPPGILDENGRVKKKSLGVIEYEEGETGRPEYIVWDASLENAFKEVEKLIEELFMISETSPDILGMGQGQADSGRALRLKLLRTIAKAKRKKLYYDKAIKEMIYVAQLLGKEYNVSIMGETLKGKPEIPEIEWQDGLPNDPYEAAQIEQIRIDTGNTTTADSIMRLDNVDEEAATKKAEQIKSESRISLPSMNFGNNPFGQNQDNGNNNQ